MLYVGDGMRAPENGEMIGKVVNKDGRRGVVIANDAFTITVKWESWFSRMIRKLRGQK